MVSEPILELNIPNPGSQDFAIFMAQTIPSASERNQALRPFQVNLHQFFPILSEKCKESSCGIDSIVW